MDHQFLSLFFHYVPGESLYGIAASDFLYRYGYIWLDAMEKRRFRKAFEVNTMSINDHIKIISIILFLSILFGSILGQFTDAALPFWDSLTTWGAVLTTYLVAKKFLENWIYWFVIDFISVFLFISRDLYLTAGLFFAYLIIIFFGYRSWKSEMEAS